MDDKFVDFCRSEANCREIKEVWNADFKGRSRGFLSSRGASYVKIREQKGRLTACRCPSQPCHSQARPSMDKDDVLAIVTRLMPFESTDTHGWNRDDLMKYYHYIANDGPMASLFLNKDAEDMVENGAIVNVKGQMGQHVLMALIMSRFPWEVNIKSKGVEIYTGLVNLGVNPNLAHIITWATTTQGGIISGIVPDYVCSGHSAYSWKVRDKAQWQRVIKGVPNDNSKLYTEGGWLGVHRLFDNEQYGQRTQLDNQLQRQLAVALGVPKAQAPAAALFSGPQEVKTSISLEEQCQAMAKVLLAFEQEMLQEAPPQEAKPKRKYVRKQPPVQPDNYPRPF